MEFDWKSIAAAVGKVAPVLGAALAGPAGGAVGVLVQSALGVNDPAQIPDAIASNPDAVIKLR
jgi:hypothetical protein